MAALSISPACQNPKSNQNPGRNSEIVASGFEKATIYDFEGLFWLPPAGKQPAGDDWLRIQISMSCANFWYSPPLKFVPWDVKQTNKVTVFDISQGTSFLCGRILQNSARLYEIVSESISIHPGRNFIIVAPGFEKATIYDFKA